MYKEFITVEMKYLIKDTNIKLQISTVIDPFELDKQLIDKTLCLLNTMFMSMKKEIENRCSNLE